MKIGRSPVIAAALAVLAGGWIATGQIGTSATSAEQATASNGEPPAPTSPALTSENTRSMVQKLNLT